MVNKKNIFLWTLYDFANSIVVIAFFLYFSQWLVVDKGVPDFYYNLLFAIGSAMLLFTGPVFGNIADKNGSQQKFLNRITVLAFLCFLAASLMAIYKPDKIFLVAVFFLFANYFYQFSFIFYNALLRYIAPASMWGRISGIGQTGNYLGQITAVFVTLPFAAGAVYLGGEAGRAQAFLPAAVVFFLLALPMLLFFKMPKEALRPNAGPISLRDEYKNYWRQFKDLAKIPSLGKFLLAFFFFNDAIVTCLNNFPIYLQKVFSVGDKTKSLLILGILATSAVGAMVSGWAADKIGLKKSIMWVLSAWVLIFPIMGAIADFRLFVVFCVITGFLFGAVWTIARAVMTALCPEEHLNFGFSFYTLAERVSTLVGPLSVGLITYFLTDLGILRYRIAMAAMGVFVAIGLWFLRNVKIPRGSIDGQV